MSEPSPYDTHTCATNPEGFALGFASSRAWLNRHSILQAFAVYEAIADSDGIPWSYTAAWIGFEPNAHGEGLALGIYAAVALARLSDPKGPP